MGRSSHHLIDQVSDVPSIIFYLKIGPNWPNWQCCLAGSSKTAPRILIFSTAMGAKPSFYMKFIATYAPAFFGYNNPVLARVVCQFQLHTQTYFQTNHP